jgi:hypothetical protein
LCVALSVAVEDLELAAFDIERLKRDLVVPTLGSSMTQCRQKTTRVGGGPEKIPSFARFVVLGIRFSVQDSTGF